MNETWSVIDTRNGKKICECSDERDAIMMVSFSKDRRTYIKNRYIVDQVIDITSTTDKQLPGQIGLPASQDYYISEGEGEPVIV